MPNKKPRLRGQMILHGIPSQRANYVWKRGAYAAGKREAFADINAQIKQFEDMIPRAEAAGDQQAADYMRARIMEFEQFKYDNA